MQRAFVIASLLAVGAALAACNAVLGIDVYPDIDAGGGEGGVDATIDGPIDGSSDVADASTDAIDDTDPDGMVTKPCVHPCVAGTSTCDGDGGIIQCVFNDAGCEEPLAPVACGGGLTCYGARNDAVCCDGTAPGCAPSCRVPADAGPEAGVGLTTCGPTRDENCCTSLRVASGNYLRSYDGVYNTDNSNPATISAFALDKYEVTVGRFRQFVAAWFAGWRPLNGSGVHTHLNQGRGLVDVSSDAGAYEQGWQQAWSSMLPTVEFDWNIHLNCNGTTSTWTGATDSLPINCVDWFDAYAFCIWDGGFLPSDVEWEYAAAGGGGTLGQRVYPWSSPSSSATIDCTYANYDQCGTLPIPVGELSKGAGRWGHLDLTGNLWEWTLDYLHRYETPCNDCGYFTRTIDGHTTHGGGFNYRADEIYVASARVGIPDSNTYGNDGFRCARSAP